MRQFFEKKFGLLFAAMFGIVSLLNVNYAILRSSRNALAVADLGGGAQSIPWFELFGTMPGAVLMTLSLSWLLNRYPIQRVFFMTLFAFVFFFLLFSLGIYPLLPAMKMGLISFQWLPGNEWLASWVPLFASMLYFVMAELWKIALLTVLFWGLVNQYIPLQKAKSLYAPLMLGGSLGTIVAGPLISFCTSQFLSKGSWSLSLIWMMLLIAAISGCIAWLFRFLFQSLKQTDPVEMPTSEPKPSLSIWESIRICMKSRYLMLLAWVTIADYIAYALGEIVFLDVLKERFPDPRQYCDFMGKLSLWNGILTAFSALVITPYLLKKCRWVIASLITPLTLLVTEGVFFFSLWHPSLSGKIELIVILGSLFFCLVRAAKYTLFDTSKEISFILLPPLEKMQGKLVVDGMCARLGRGSGSMISLLFVQVAGGVLASAPLAGGVALAIALSCVVATNRLGKLVEEAHPLNTSYQK